MTFEDDDNSSRLLKKERKEISRKFSLKDVKIAEFWAWLIDGYTIQPYADKDTIDPRKKIKKEDKILIVSKNEIKDLIKRSIESKDNLSTQELLRIAADSKKISYETVRKSIRLDVGEYFKLLSIKLNENSSFAEVAEKILATAMKQKIEEIKREYFDRSPTFNERLEHLTNVIDSWKDNRPKSRSMGKELSLRTEKLDTHIPNFFNDELKNFKEYVLSEIKYHSNKLTWCPPDHGLIKYFMPEWEENFESHRYFENLVLNVTVSPDDPDKFILNLQFKVQTLMELKEEKELIDTFGEECLKEFINHFVIEQGGMKSNATRYEGLKYSDNKEFALFSYVFNFPTYYGEIKTPNNVEIIKGEFSELVSPNITHDIEEYNQLIQDLECELGYQNTGTKHGPYVSMCVEKIRDEVINKFEPGSRQYLLAHKLTNLMQVFNFHISFDHFISSTIRLSLHVDSVITIYINADLLKLLPVILTDSNWLLLADKYRQIHNIHDGGIQID